MDFERRPHVRKDGTEMVRVGLEIKDPETGKRRFIGGGTFVATDEQAIQAAGHRLLFEYETNLAKRVEIGGSTLLRDWADEWLPRHGRARKQGTVLAHRQRLDDYILPFLGSLPIKSIDQLVIERWLDKLPTLPIQRQALGTLRVCLKAGVGKFIEINPAAGDFGLKGSPAVQEAEAEEKQVKIWERADLVKLVETARGMRAEGLVTLCLYFGMRPGEALALRWSDIDLDANKLTIRRTKSRANAVTYIDTPKTGKSRTLSISPTDKERLQRLKTLYADIDQSDIIGGPNLVMPGRLVGYPASWLKALCKKAGVPYLNPHCLRHTYATLALRAGVPIKAVSNALGHKTSRETIDTYEHLLEEDVSLVCGVIDAALA